MPEIAVAKPAKKDAALAEQAGGLGFMQRSPMRRTIGRDVAVLSRAPQRASHRGGAPHESAGAGDRAGAIEDMRRVSVEVIPPQENCPWAIDGNAVDHCPWHAEFGLVCEFCSRPLRRQPDAREHDREHDEDLSDEQLGRGHASLRPHSSHSLAGRLESRRIQCTVSDTGRGHWGPSWGHRSSERDCAYSLGSERECSPAPARRLSNSDDAHAFTPSLADRQFAPSLPEGLAEEGRRSYPTSLRLETASYLTLVGKGIPMG